MQKSKTKNLVLCALFCALTAVAAQLILPLAPVPFTFSMVAVYLTGAMLDKTSAFYAQFAYVLLGAVGAPVFSGFMGGPAKLFGPTGGYIIAYPLMAFLIALLAERWGRGFVKNSVAMLIALLVCYTLGTAWLAISTKSTFLIALGGGVIPFVPFDLLKIVGTSLLAVSLNRVLSKSHLLTATL